MATTANLAERLFRKCCTLTFKNYGRVIWKITHSEDFQQEFQQLLKDYVGRPTPLYLAERLSQGVRSEYLPQAGGSVPYRRP